MVTVFIANVKWHMFGLCHTTYLNKQQFYDMPGINDIVIFMISSSN